MLISQRTQGFVCTVQYNILTKSEGFTFILALQKEKLHTLSKSRKELVEIAVDERNEYIRNAF